MATVPNRVFTSGEGARHVAPLAEHVEQRADEAAASARPWTMLPSGFRNLIATAANDQRDAEPAEKSENSLQHIDSSLPPPPFAVHRLGRQEQPERDETQVVDEVLGVDDAAREVVEVLGDRQVVQHRRASSARRLCRSS